MEEIACQNPFRLSAQELTPRWTAAPWAGVDAGALEDGPHRGRADLTSHASQFTGDAPISPVRILTGHTQDHCADRGPRRWTPKSLPREGPPSLDKISVPAQQRARCHE